MFPRNEGALDRIIRFVAGLGLGIVAVVALTGPWQIVAGVVAAILLVTGLVGFCPLYALLRIDTRGREVRAATRHELG
jgi:Protein of unknown function (DUF2892)